MYWDLLVDLESGLIEGLESFPPFGREFAFARSCVLGIVIMVASCCSAKVSVVVDDH